MSLSVTVKSAKDLPNLESFGKSDPLCVLHFQGKTYETDPVKGDLNPTWDSTFQFDLAEALRRDDHIQVQVFDWERAGGNKLMGQLDVSLRRCVTAGSMEINESLCTPEGEPISGKIELSASYTPSASGDSSGGGGGDADDGGGGGDFDGGGFDDGGDGSAPTADEAAGGAKSARGVVFGGTGPEGLKARQAMLARKRANRAALPKKPCDFQVRIHVIEGRKLHGGNLNPVCNVRVFDQVQPTAVKKSTNAPLFDQIFFFSFHSAPKEFLDKVVTFEVMNSQTLRADAMIGSFQFDTGFCYDFENHSIVHKWLLLTKPGDSSGGPRGYLKVSCQVIGPNDDVKPAPRTSSDTSDIESNLLRPSGTTLAPSTFTVQIYRAMDVPQMDSSFGQRAKNLVRIGAKVVNDLADPYVEVSFAGNKSETTAVYNCYNPVFNEQLNIGCQFPSMCDRVRLRLFDKDKFSPDVIGTTFLNLSEISAPGDAGFLPTFGPAWVNVYGSHREYSAFNQYSYLDDGSLEGVAYRGRLLVEVESTVGKYPDSAKPMPIEKTDVDRVERYFMLPRKYQLRAAFLEATLIPETLAGSAVSFEVSIGVYGNLSDQSLPQSTSVTQGTHPVPYGNSFYYIPWGQSKPCVSVEAHFEIIEDRIHGLNLLLSTSERLKANIARIRHMHQAQAGTRETARAFIDLLDELMKDLSSEDRVLPEPTRRNPIVTKLDFLIYDVRKKEVADILQGIKKLRKSATDLVSALLEVELFSSRLDGLAIEGQNSIPDIVISMLLGKKRVAYARIPAHEVMYAHKDGQKWHEACGKNCSKPQTIYMKWPSKNDGSAPNYQVACQLRIGVWLGLNQYSNDWLRGQDEGEISVFAETYENEVNYGFGWGTKGLFIPPWSNAHGSVALEQNKFMPPEGWNWNGDWFLNPELSAPVNPDSGKSEYMEDIFEYQQRIAGTQWSHATVSWGNVRGETLAGGREDIQIGDEWEWKDPKWKIDKTRVCDEGGYQYTLDPSLATYVPIEKTYHLWRRRRWVRTRALVAGGSDQKKKDQDEEHMKEGWEYSHSFSGSFHVGKKLFDKCRHRRWHRKVVAAKDSDATLASPTFYFNDPEKGIAGHQETPRMFMRFKEPHRYQLRVYLYQARNIRSADSTGLSDPYCRLSFSHHCETSIILKETIMPTWDQTLIMDNIDLFGELETIAACPPDLTIELFDEDIIGKDEFLGRCVVKPYIRLEPRHPPPKLDWYPIKFFDKDAGEVLAAFHLLVSEGNELPFAPERMEDNNKLFRVPHDIRPRMQSMRVEALCWGVRDLKRLQLLSVDKPFVTITVGGVQMKTAPIKKMKKCPNYDDPLLVFKKVLLPREELYMPPMSVQVFDNRAFGRTPLAGTHTIIDMTSYKRDRFQYEAPREMHRPANYSRRHSPFEHVVEVRGTVLPNLNAEGAADDKKADTGSVHSKGSKKGKNIDEDDRQAAFVDWWSKYYASVGGEEEAMYEDYLKSYTDMITIYSEPLEKVFGGFNDFVDTFFLYRGKGQRDSEDAQNQAVGKFKGIFCIYPLPEDQSEEPPLVLQNTPASGEQKCIIRVYVIKGMNLQSQDASGKNDPYLRIYLGSERLVNDKSNYIPNTVDPVFGKMFQVKASLPVEHQLKVQVMDWDLLSADDLVGETVIDLEDRLLTKNRATCGLPKSYCVDGTNAWRDNQRPTAILNEVCGRRGITPPVYHGDSRCTVADHEYEVFPEDDAVAPQDELGDLKERLALKVLHNFELVPEHIETRPLFNPLRPSLPCGEIQMWVDIFLEKRGKPRAPVNIAPRRPEDYELRVIIYNVEEVPLDDESITGEAMSDIYLKGWFKESVDKKHKTDVHYRSLNGEGNFNWRWIMPFAYIPQEKKMVIRKREGLFSWDKTEFKLPPTLVVQVWDNDLFSLDDYLGDIELDLTFMPPPVKRSKNCSMKQLDPPGPKTKKKYQFVSLLESKSLKGWWPITGVDANGDRIPAGKVEMEIEIMRKDESEAKPAGEARDDPNANPTLDPPNRPQTSFLWFTSPWKVLKFIIWRRFRKAIITALIISVISALVALFIYASPGYAVRKLFGFQ
ncbi:myoferlin-like isoform X2 [Sycon ciliatum]|uniref:myoferlin-like isoform X2 n=1 Tax=Sycon ciliatum TaxID=27933 RepID=UPI0020AED752|eukprot:scpid5026/ scgid20121/ Myoferlin; Fer-1-like protein 3